MDPLGYYKYYLKGNLNFLGAQKILKVYKRGFTGAAEIKAEIKMEIRAKSFLKQVQGEGEFHSWR